MLTLVIGGSASGKSAFAERLAVQSGLPRFYVATMRVWDAESERRVARHRDMRREKRFDTLECPIGLDRLILPARGTALLEDMGNLVANELYDADGAGRDAVEAAVRGYQPFEEVLHTRAGCTVSSHCGPRTLGILYFTK